MSITMLGYFWKTFYWCKAVVIGVKGMRTTKLGSHVRYQGEVWTIYNWSNSPYSHLSIGNISNRRCEQYVPREDFEEVRSIREYLHRFRVMYRWYMTSWHSIEVNRRLHPEWFAQREV